MGETQKLDFRKHMSFFRCFECFIWLFLELEMRGGLEGRSGFGGFSERFPESAIPYIIPVSY